MVVVGVQVVLVIARVGFNDGIFDFIPPLDHHTQLAILTVFFDYTGYRGEAMADTQASVPFFKKGKSRPTTSRRQRSESPPSNSVRLAGPSSSNHKSEVVLPTRKSGGNLLSAGTKRTTNQRDDAGRLGDIDESTRDGPDVKWSASGSHQQAAQDILAGDEAEELLERRNKKTRLNTDQVSDDETKDGMYHGQKAYKSHIKKNVEVPKNMRVGPQKSTSTIRTVTIVDYQPDVCKDYKGAFACCQSRSILTINVCSAQRRDTADLVIRANSYTIEEHVRLRYRLWVNSRY